MLGVFVYSARWPYERRAWLRAVSNVAYNFELMGYGSFSFDLPANDSQGVVAGDLIGITSDMGVPDFLGGVDRLQTTSAPTVRVTGRELSAVLADRLVAQQRTYLPAAGGDIARDMIRRVSGRNQTGIVPLPTGGSTPITSAFTTRSESVLEGLEDISHLTGWEWEMRYTVATLAEAKFVWARQAGFDVRTSMRLTNRVISDARYEFDALSEKQIVQIVGSLGDFAARPSAAAVADGPVALQDLATVRVPVRSSTRKAQRSGIFTSREAAILETALPDGLSVQRRATEDILLATSGKETLSLSVTPSADWSQLRAGNIVTVELAGYDFGEDIIRPYRIYGMQPDDEGGLCYLTGKVLSAA